MKEGKSSEGYDKPTRLDPFSLVRNLDAQREFMGKIEVGINKERESGVEIENSI
jgi:hypothetical protein